MIRILIIVILLGGALTFVYQPNRPSLNQSPDNTAEVVEIEWQDLLPETEPLADPLAATQINVRYDLGFIGKVLADADAGLISREGQEYRNAMRLLDEHRTNNVDVDELLAAVSERDRQIEQRGEQVNNSLDGKFVRLPGYALPLEMAERGVTEFLLVPYVGACIHVPPPPPNQVVLAQLQTAYRVANLYEPVWITGQLKTQSTSTELFLVDGQAQVPMGYSMQVEHVESME